MKISANMTNLKDLGIKSTSARSAVIDMLEKTDKPVDVAAILDYLRAQGLSTDQATVYRILDIFHKKGIIQKIELGEGKYRYEKSDEDHHHLICTSCGRVEDIEDKNMIEFEAEIKKKKGFLVKHHSLEFFGLCKDCQL